MPELKPCPACGSVNCRLIEREMSAYVVCDFKGCWMSGPIKEYADSAIAAWNKLPRRPDYNDVDCAGCPERRRGYLTWGEEPPKVAGWYWLRDVSHKGEATTLYMSQSQVERLKTYPGEEWAGPIPEPLEPEES